MYLLDFETKSRRPIWHGHDNYFQDETADVLCLAYGDEDAEEPGVWWPGCGYDPEDLWEYAESGGLIGASYAAFDQGAWEYLCVEKYGFPVIHPDQWYCTQAQSRIAGLPSALDTSAQALRSEYRKSRRGEELIKIMCIPPFKHTPELLAELVEYCRQDWWVMRAVFKATPLLPQHLFRDYRVNEEINGRGVKIDLVMALCARSYADAEREEIAEQLQYVTAGAVEKPTQHVRFKNWLLACLEEDGCEDAIKLMVRYKKGEKKFSVDKRVRENMLADPVALKLDPALVEGLNMMDDAAGAAVAKYKRMAQLSCDEDDRVRGAMRFAGAPSTIRYSSLGLQFHNFRRDAFPLEDVMHYRAQMVAKETLTDPKTEKPVRIMDTLGKLIRGAIIPEDGKVFVVGDWSAVESRMTAWLARDEKKLKLFRDGGDPYLYAAEAVYGRSISAKDDPEERQIGKVLDLAAGFLGGPGALASMAVTYGVYIPEEDRKRLIDSWRMRHPRIVKFGKLLFATAMRAMHRAGTWCKADRVAYLFDGSALFCRLPDGKTVLRYPEARVEMTPAPWDKEQKIPAITALKAAFTKGRDDTEWPRHSLWRGLLLENVVQASCAILLRRIVAEFKEWCVFHVHDEVILEVVVKYAEAMKQKLREEMGRALNWCSDLPLVAEPVIMTRYGK